jgi:hypothetical protein
MLAGVSWSSPGGPTTRSFSWTCCLWPAACCCGGLVVCRSAPGAATTDGAGCVSSCYSSSTWRPSGVISVHLDRFNFGQLIAHAFFIIVSAMTVTTTRKFTRPCHPHSRRRGQEGAAPPGPTVKAWLIAVAIVAAAWASRCSRPTEGQAISSGRGRVICSRAVSSASCSSLRRIYLRSGERDVLASCWR